MWEWNGYFVEGLLRPRNWSYGTAANAGIRSRQLAGLLATAVACHSHRSGGRWRRRGRSRIAADRLWKITEISSWNNGQLV